MQFSQNSIFSMIEAILNVFEAYVILYISYLPFVLVVGFSILCFKAFKSTNNDYLLLNFIFRDKSQVTNLKMLQPALGITIRYSSTFKFYKQHQQLRVTI